MEQYGKLNNGKQAISQIIPGDGWEAVYVYDDDTRKVRPIVCWALVEYEHGKMQAICGFTPEEEFGLVNAEDIDHFSSYRRVGTQF